MYAARFLRVFKLVSSISIWPVQQIYCKFQTPRVQPRGDRSRYKLQRAASLFAVEAAENTP